MTASETRSAQIALETLVLSFSLEAWVSTQVLCYPVRSAPHAQKQLDLALEPRLRWRYGRLVAAHSNAVNDLAAGIKALPGQSSAFAHTQALWRFLENERTTPEVLMGPVLAGARTAVEESCSEYALAIHDWSHLNYFSHSSKTDRVQMTHQRDVGYELQSTVLLNDRQGDPLGAVVQNLVTQRGVHSTYAACTVQREHLEELSERLQWLEGQGFSKPLVHIVDREADSVGHLRHWSAAGQRWLVRARESRSVEHAGKPCSLKSVGEQLEFEFVREVEHRGCPAQQWLASSTVVMNRAAKPARKTQAGQRVAPVRGEPLEVRLVVSSIRDAQGKVLALWYLLSNVESQVSAERLALWYYWRWRIESYFKLLKSAGHCIESWEQETGLAILKRLLIAGHACALAWTVMRLSHTNTQARETAEFLVRLSGRQMKRTQPITASAMLAGLYQLFAMLEILEQYSPDELRSLGRIAFPNRPKERARDV